MFAIFASAKDEFEGGYLFDLRNLVHADVFSGELEQAKHFLSQGYKVPTAVIAGTVLESTLRELCDQHPSLQPVDKLNRMNDDLAREGVYNKMRADQVRAWAKIRNDAAHGYRLGSIMEFAGYDDSISPRRIEQLKTSAIPYLASPFTTTVKET